MKKDLILIVGKSGTGKTFFKRIFQFDAVISYTTRSKRIDEKQNIDYKFITNKEYQDLILKKDFIRIAENDINGDKYFTTIEEILKREIYIIDKKGVDSLKEEITQHNVPRQLLVVYLKCNLLKRLYRMIKRGDSIQKCFKRLRHDAKSYKNVQFDFLIKT